MKSPLFWKLFLSFLLTAVLINQSTWVIYFIWWEPGPSWERMESERSAPIEFAAARLAVEAAGPAGLDRLQASLPEEYRGNILLDQTGAVRDDENRRTLVATGPDGVRHNLVYLLKGTAERHYGLLDILYRSMDYLIASLLGGALFAAALAWYLTRPIRQVRNGFEALAGGDLGIRLAPAMGRRRDEFADLARDFDGMAERLQQLVGLRDRLLHDVSHELRSPLARMNVAIALQRQGRATPGTSLERIEAEARRLDELVGELLSLSRAESGVAQEESYFDLGSLVETVAANARFEAQAGNVAVRTVQAAGSPIIQGSAELMRRALENLLRNAIRVSQPGDAVSITVCSPQREGEVEILVADQGPGVPASRLEAIFDPFVRGQDGPAPGQGYGLGLAIARRAITALKGTIHARNLDPNGLAVSIIVPVAQFTADME